MEEKLRNLSQNIAANTGDEHKPKIHHPEDEAPEEPKAEETHAEEEKHDVDQEEKVWEGAEEVHEEVSDYSPEPEKTIEEPEAEPEEPVAEPEELEHETTEEAPVEEPAPVEDEPKIIPIVDETEAPEEPKAEEAPVEEKKYSPEVEAALNRLKNDDISVDVDTEPLSTEPKKTHHGGRILLLFLFVIAIAAMVLCVLVEQKVIENPLDLISGKKQGSSEVVDKDTEKVKLTDGTLISTVDALFSTIHEDDNYYIFDRTYQKISGVEYIFYDVAEPATETGAATLSEELTTESLTNCEDNETDTTNCVTSPETINAENYEDYPHYRYTFAKGTWDYEFREKYLISAAPTE